MRVQFIGLLVVAVAAVTPQPVAPSLHTSAGRLLWTVPIEASTQTGLLSPDGRYMAYGNADDGNVYLRDLMSGTSRQVTDRQEVTTPGGAGPGEVSDPGALSHDGRQLAYSWFTGTPLRAELHIADVSRPSIGGQRVLLNDADIRWVQPRAWRADGSAIVAGIWRRGAKEAQLALVSTVDGSVRVLRAVPWNGNDSTTLGTVALSQDGKRLAFGPLTKDGTTRDVVVFDIATGADVLTIADPSSDNPAAWTPDGKELIFTSDRGGTPGFWAAAINASGAPNLRHIGPAIDGYADYIGLTPAGALVYYTYPATRWRAGLVSIDFGTGRVLARAAEAAPGFAKFNLFPDTWSPDGGRLAFVSDSETPGDDHFVVLRDARTGQATRMRPKLAAYQNVIWSPDGRELVTRGAVVPGSCCGIFRVNAETGEVAEVIARSEWFRAWLPDGRVLFDRREADGSGGTALVEHDSSQGTDRILHRWPNGESGRLGVTLSPDGRILYYRSPSSVAAPPHRLIAKDLASGTETALLSGRLLGSIVTVANGRFVLTSSEGALLLVPTAGGAPVSIPKVGGAEPTILAWADDGRSLLGRTRGTAPNAATYWWVPLDGRAPRSLDLGVGPHAGGFSVRASSVAFSERLGPASPPPEVRALEKFVPARREDRR